jgi:hypothetical protein
MACEIERRPDDSCTPLVALSWGVGSWSGPMIWTAGSGSRPRSPGALRRGCLARQEHILGRVLPGSDHPSPSGRGGGGRNRRPPSEEVAHIARWDFQAPGTDEGGAGCKQRMASPGGDGASGSSPASIGPILSTARGPSTTSPAADVPARTSCTCQALLPVASDHLRFGARLLPRGPSADVFSVRVGWRQTS